MLTSINPAKLHRLLLITALALSAVISTAEACIPQPDGVVGAAPSSGELPANGVILLQSFSNIIDRDAMSVTVNDEPAEFTLLDLDGVSTPFMKISAELVVGDQVVLTVSSADMFDASGMTDYSWTVTEPVDDATPQTFESASRIVTDQNHEPELPSNCEAYDGDTEYMRRRDDVIFALIPRADMPEGSYVVVHQRARQSVEYDELEIDGIPYVQLSLGVSTARFEEAGPGELGELECVELAILSPAGVLSEPKSFCEPCVFKTVDEAGELLSRASMSEACGHADLSLIDEFADQGEVIASAQGEDRGEAGGCDQSGEHSAIWTLFVLIALILKRRAWSAA